MTEFKLPERLNAATALVDSHLTQGRGAKPAILCGERTVSYAEMGQCVNRLGRALLRLGVRMEERVALLLPDSPEWVYTFFGAMKLGAVAVPLNTMLKPQDYVYLLNDCRARVLVTSPALADAVASMRGRLQFLEHVVVAGADVDGCLRLERLMEKADDSLDPADTCKDDAAFWLYSSGTTEIGRASCRERV